MKYLGLDVGNRRVGIAFGDSDLRIATPVTVVTRTNIEHDAQTIARLVHDYDATKLIVGLPRNMDGTQGMQAEAVIEYARTLEALVQVPVIFWDERLTTLEATQRTQSAGARGKKSRQGLDAIAAAVILQDYLDSQTNEKQDTNDFGDDVDRPDHESPGVQF